MPLVAPSICATCHRPGCAGHHRPWTHAQPLARRLRGRALQRARAQLFETQPLCVACQAAGRVTVATDRDHVVNLAAGGRDTPDNAQPLCGPCHRAKTAREARVAQDGQSR